ncbi:MAG: T9SS type A sorting domain-containing protein [Bacteroidota bacterium]
MLYAIQCDGRSLIATLAVSFFLFNALIAQSGLPASITTLDPTTAQIDVGSASNQASNLHTVSLKLASETGWGSNPPHNCTVSLTGSWFTSATGSWTATWTYPDDSSYVILEIYDTNEDTYSGYGKFLTLENPSGIGNLTLEDIFRRTDPGITVTATGTGATTSDWKAYPNPISAGATLFLSGVPRTETLTMTDAQGRRVYSGSPKNGRITLPTLPRGTYFLMRPTIDGQTSRAQRIIVE